MVIVYTSIIMVAGCASQAVIYDNAWQNHPVKVDGKAKEWDIPLQYYDNDTKLNFTITNDDSNLYYCIRITDDKQEMRVMRAGMQVWIDTSGKRAEQVGIQYPFSQVSGKMLSGEARNSSSSDSSRMSLAHSHFKENSKEMKLTGFIPPIGGPTPVPNVDGINVCIARDSAGVMLYEGCIPFKTFYKPALSSTDKGKVFGIIFILNPIEGSGHTGGHSGKEVGSMGEGNRMGGGGMGGMSRMGGGGGGHRGGGSGEDAESSSSESLHFKIRLATK